MSNLSETTYGTRLHTDLDEHAVSVIIEAAKLIGQSLNPQTAIEGILKLAAESLQLNQGRILLPNKQTGVLHIKYAYGISEQEQLKGVYALGEGVTGKVMASGDIALVPNIALEPTYVAKLCTPPPTDNKPIAYIAVPIVEQEKTIGVLAVHPAATEHNQLKIHLFLLQVLAQMICQVLNISVLVKEKTKRLVNENEALKQQSAGGAVTFDLQGNSPLFNAAVRKAILAAKSTAAVLLTGESGSGKEKFARLIHQYSDRNDSPFICINCAAIPAQLLESELFGHEKGSFTGATSTRVGKFELASGGTLFLDEIGDMSLDLQSKLLRVLQEKTVQKVGANKEIPVDVRIIAATNANLENSVNSGEFRLDLFYRLNVVRISLPTLRERKEDIRLLALHFLSRENQRYRRNVILAADALQVLENYQWPGNIRQLENVIERAVIMSSHNTVTATHIQSMLNEEASIDIESKNPTRMAAGHLPFFSDVPSLPVRGYNKVSNDEQPRILEALHMANGNKTAAAKILGMTPRQLHYRLKKLQISEKINHLA
ncbi:sigma 54-interacting transcriptional regulator [Kaarinaea lacus]